MTMTEWAKKSASSVSPIGQHLSIQAADATSRLSCLGKGGRNLHHEGFAETAEDMAARLDVPGALGDIIIVFVDDDPASLEVAESGALALYLRDVQRHATALRRLRGGEK